MANRFIRDLTIGNADERRARQLKGMETATEVPPFRASVITKSFEVSGPYAGTALVAVNGSKTTILATGMYLVNYTADGEIANAGGGYISTILSASGGAVGPNQSVGEGANSARLPVNGTWGGLLKVGETIEVKFASPGSINVVIQGGSMTVVRLA